MDLIAFQAIAGVPPLYAQHRSQLQNEESLPDLLVCFVVFLRPDSIYSTYI